MSIVPSAGISVIYPDPVVQTLLAQGATPGLGRLGMRSGLGCGNGVGPEIPWQDAYGGYQLMGKDVDYQAVALSGLGDRMGVQLRVPGNKGGIGDWVPAAYSVPENPVMRGYQAMKWNALANQLAGLNGIDTSSFSNFVSSISTGTGDFIPGVSDLLVLGGAAVLLVMLASGSSKRGRR
jgi:hypothetical protein